MPDFTHLKRQFIAWYGVTPSEELLAAFERYPDGAEFEDRFLESHARCLIHTDASGAYKMGWFRLGQSMDCDYMLKPTNGRVHSISFGGETMIEFGSVREFLIWMLELEEETGDERVRA